MGWRPSHILPPRRWQRVLLVVLALVAAAWFGVPQLFVPTIRAKLQGMISGKLDARLEIGRLMYAPPFGVRARNVRLVSNGTGGQPGGVELLKVRTLDLKLAHLPLRKGPLVIQNVTVSEPELHLVRTEDGHLLGMHRFVKDNETPPATQPSAPVTQPAKLDVEDPDDARRSAERAKLSDMFELRHFGIKAGRVVYEDRTRPGLPPVVWKDLDVGMETTPQTKAVYGYTFDARNRDVASLKSSGRFDLDQLLVELGELHVEVRTSYDSADSPLPAPVQKVLRDYQVAGRVTLDAHGRFPVRDRKAATFNASLDLRDASAYSPQWDSTLDRLAVKLSLDNRTGTAADAPAGPLHVRLEAFDAASGETSLRLDKAEVVVDRGAGTWSAAQLAGLLHLGGDGATLPKKSRPVFAGMNPRGDVQFTLAAKGNLSRGDGRYILAPEDLALLAYPRGVFLQPRKAPAPLAGVGGGGSVRKDLGSRVVVFDNVSFDYGGDPILLTSARLPLPNDMSNLRDQLRIEEISGTIDFHRPGPHYPGKFGRVVEHLRPVGPFVVGRDSWYSVTKVNPELRVRSDPAEPPRIPPWRKSDWFFSVSTDSGSFTLTRDRIPLTNLRGDATVSNMLIDVRRLEADVLGGKISGAMKVTPSHATTYEGRAYLRGIDLEAVSRVYIVPETPGAKLSGEGNLDIDFVWTKPPQEQSPVRALRAAGEFEVLRGQFWTIPVLGEVARQSGGGKPMTIGEAAGVFRIGDGQVVLKSAAVSSPALGVQGSGRIGLDKSLDLNLIAAPLGDWRDRVRQTNVPILSDVAAEVFGAAQHIVNTATSTLLYQFHITGTTHHPNVSAVPVPVLTEPAAVLFGAMMRGDQGGPLLKSVRRTAADPRAKPQ